MFTKRQIEAQLRLFKGYLLDDANVSFVDPEACYGKGLLFTKQVPINIYLVANELYGKDSTKWNNTFHKSFATVRDLPLETLVAQQIIHYFTTYGFEELGIYDSELVYIPYEKLEVPEITEDIPLIVIKELTEEQLKEKMMVLLTSGIALSKETISDIMELSDYINLNKIHQIKNKEVKSALYEKYHIVPSNNQEFLRYLIKKATGKTLLIKDKATIQALKNAETHLLWSELNNYVSKYGYEKLSEIFLRYKDLFIAMKRPATNETAKLLNAIINKLRRRANTNHKPLESNILDRLTQIKTLQDVTENRELIIEELNKVPLFRVVRILNSFRIRETNIDYMLAKIRNGKAYVYPSKHNTIDTNKHITQIELQNLIKRNLLDRLRHTLTGKTIYMPEVISYAIPQSEKQFMGDIPEGSYVEVKREDDMVLGIHWTNLDNDSSWDSRVDLDLHAQNRNEQYGWSSSYRSSDGSDFYFSGDLTDAPKPNGATEVFYIGKNCGHKEFLLTLNNYTSNKEDVPFEFFIAKTDRSNINKDYVVDPNKVIVSIPRIFECGCAGSYTRQITLGFIRITNSTIRFYFNDVSLGSSIVTRQTNTIKSAYDCLDAASQTQLMLNDVLKDAGVTFLDKPTYEKLEPVETFDENGNQLFRKVIVKADYDFSLEAIDKTSIIKLMMEEK